MNSSISKRLPLGFCVFWDAARLIWRSRILRRLALAEILVTVAWFLILVMFLEGMSHGAHRAVFGVDVPLAVYLAIGTLGVLFGFFGIPVIGPIVWTIRARTVEHTCWLLAADAGKSSPPTRSAQEWLLAIVAEGPQLYRRLFLMGFTSLTVISFAAWLIPGEASPLQTRVQALLVLTLIALNTILNSGHRTASRIEFIRAHWRDIVGYVIGSWLFTLLGFVPLVINLLAVAEELFHRRVNLYQAWPDQERFDMESKGPEPTTSPHAHANIETHIQEVYRKAGSGLKWDTRLPPGMRFVYIPLRRHGDREIDTIDGALIPVGKDALGDPNAATEFWFSRADYVGDYWVGKPPLNGDQLARAGDVFAGPFRVRG
jgi:hypothetical protein